MKKRHWSYWLSILLFVAAISAFFLWIYYFISTVNQHYEHGPRPIPVYSEGDLVQSVISGQRGQVINTLCYRNAEACWYRVRFVGLSMTTNTHLLGPDSPISTEPLSVVEMREFELTPYKGN